jgi:hypothetical protein
MKMIESELLEIKHGRFDTAVGVSICQLYCLIGLTHTNLIFT